MATLQLAATLARNVVAACTHAALPDTDDNAGDVETALMLRQGTRITQWNIRVQAQNRMFMSLMSPQFKWRKNVVLLGLALWPIVFGVFLSPAMSAARDMLHSKDPCTGPGFEMLQYFVLGGVALAILTVLMGMLGVARECRPRRFRHSFRLMFSAGMNLCILAWGYHMVEAAAKSHTCDHQFIEVTRMYIYVDFASATMLFGISVLAVGAFRRLTFHLATIQLAGEATGTTTYGCLQVVMETLKKEKPPPEIDVCPICSVSFEEKPQSTWGNPLHEEAETAKGVVVKTPCAHYYHQYCLAEWCKVHVSCPFCRQSVAAGQPGTYKSWGRE